MTGKYHHGFEVGTYFLRQKRPKQTKKKLDFISIKSCSLKSENASYRVEKISLHMPKK